MLELFKPKPAPVDPQPLPWPDLQEARKDEPSAYLASSGLSAAVNVAINLGKPLLLTGEPGTGKTQLADAIAWQLSRYAGFEMRDRALKFQVGSTSVARELFYSFDRLRQFSDYQIVKDAKARPSYESYLTLSPLGIAFLLAQPENRLYARVPAAFRTEMARPQRSVVLIDEIDKAPRDFPNDLLNELDSYAFSVPELAPVSAGYDLGESALPSVRIDGKWRPVIVITSNSEKHLPDAFLRRCIFFHIDFPDRDTLLEIAMRRLLAASRVGSGVMSRALTFFYELRERPPEPHRKPGTAELLDWLDLMLRVMAGAAEPGVEDITARAETYRGTLSALAKNEDDLKRARAMFDSFFGIQKT